MGTIFDSGKIVTAFAEAATDSSRWDAAMEVTATATGGFGAALFPIKGHLPRLPCSPSMEASFETYIRDGWIFRDERYRGVPNLLQRGVTTDLDFARPNEIARHPYYQDFLARFGLRWFAGIKVAAGDDLWCLSIQRSIEQGPFSATEAQELAVLSKQLGSGATLARALGFACAESALDAFSVSGSSVVLLDRCGEVLQLNSAAEQLLGSDLQVCRRRIVSLDRKATAAFECALRAILWDRTSSLSMPPVLLPRANGHPLLAHLLRLSSVSACALGPCQVIVVIVDPDARPRQPESLLRSCFGLTRAEVKVATPVAAGETLQTTADQLGISYETARNQLKSVFAKTGTHRQAELVSLLARLWSGYHVSKG